jgi:hypothetical protein
MNEHGYSLAGNLDPDRVLQTSPLELGHLGRHRRREQVGPSFVLRDDLEDLVQDRSKVEVEETVGFVHDLRDKKKRGKEEEEEEERGSGDCQDRERAMKSERTNKRKAQAGLGGDLGGLTKYLRFLNEKPFVFSR